MPLMGIRAYGRHRNVSHVAVLKALRTGRIRQNAEGLIDSDQADRDWATKIAGKALCSLRSSGCRALSVVSILP